jgi:hypothetical protein
MAKAGEPLPVPVHELHGQTFGLTAQAGLIDLASEVQIGQQPLRFATLGGES